MITYTNDVYFFKTIQVVIIPLEKINQFISTIFNLKSHHVHSVIIMPQGMQSCCHNKVVNYK